MSRLSKGIIIFCAEYLVVAVGLVLLIFILEKGEMLAMVESILICGSLLLIALVCAKILKRIIHKSRPPRQIEFFMPFDRYAFPSGHATALSSISLFIAFENHLFGMTAIILSLIIVVARVWSRVHDTTDIIGGIIVGTIVTYFLMPYVTAYVHSYLIPAML